METTRCAECGARFTPGGSPVYSKTAFDTLSGSSGTLVGYGRDTRCPRCRNRVKRYIGYGALIYVSPVAAMLLLAGVVGSIQFAGATFGLSPDVAEILASIAGWVFLLGLIVGGFIWLGRRDDRRARRGPTNTTTLFDD